MSFMKRFYVNTYAVICMDNQIIEKSFSVLFAPGQKGNWYKLLDIIGDLKYLKSFHIAF